MARRGAAGRHRDDFDLVQPPGAFLAVRSVGPDRVLTAHPDAKDIAGQSAERLVAACLERPRQGVGLQDSLDVRERRPEP